MQYRISVRRFAITSTRHLTPLTKTVLGVWANDSTMAKTGHVVATTPFGWILSLPEQRADPHWMAVLPDDLAQCVAWAYQSPIDATHLEFDDREEPFPGLEVRDDEPHGLSSMNDAARTIRVLTEELISFRGQVADLRPQASEISRRLLDYIGANQTLAPGARQNLTLIDAFMRAPLGQSSVTPLELLNLASQASKSPAVLGMVQTIDQVLGRFHEPEDEVTGGQSKPKDSSKS